MIFTGIDELKPEEHVPDKFEIIGTDMQLLRLHMEPGEMVVAEPGAMIYMSENVTAGCDGRCARSVLDARRGRRLLVRKEPNRSREGRFHAQATRTTAGAAACPARPASWRPSRPRPPTRTSRAAASGPGARRGELTTSARVVAGSPCSQALTPVRPAKVLPVPLKGRRFLAKDRAFFASLGQVEVNFDVDTNLLTCAARRI